MAAATPHHNEEANFGSVAMPTGVYKFIDKFKFD